MLVVHQRWQFNVAGVYLRQSSCVELNVGQATVGVWVGMGGWRWGEIAVSLDRIDVGGFTSTLSIKGINLFISPHLAYVCVYTRGIF